MLSLGLSIGTGIPWAGHPVQRRCRVLYVVGEGSHGLDQRIEAWEIANPHGASRGVDHYFTTIPDAIQMGVYESDDVSYIIEIATALDIDVVIFDTLHRMIANHDENSSIDMGNLIDNSDRIARAIDGLVIHAHHNGKDTTRGMRGSSALPGGLDLIFEVKRAGLDLTVICEKLRDTAEFPPIRFRAVPKGASLALEHDDGHAPTLHAADDSVARLALLVAERDDGTAVGNGVLFEAYEEETGLKKSTFYKVKKAAVDAGLIRNVGTEKVPRYQVSAPPEHAPETGQDAGQPEQAETGAKC